ncbi:MAG TPA: translation initiation factor IF-2 [Candidatus Woesebacteria bacterium]|nr:translation initiation factor IF-2 [Candidatus Woesebacteria bacterium]HNS65416.1 translation initiation factor IF-2 [Candidatus Woesebacteria bacterium]
MALQPRPPVVTIMGHVDHGKTTLLDYLRKSRITAGEAGGITQHIGAYQIEHKGKKITFIDTPGHAAFNKMRERGAAVTDFVILVVAANDGVKPQTIESIRHIKAANVPVVVAINKIDLPNVYPDVAKGELAQHGIQVVDMGGDVEAVAISALKGTGVDALLDTISVMADLQNISGDPEAALRAIVIESAMDARKGVTASVIVQQGTLRGRQLVQTEEVSGRVRMLTNDKGESLVSVGPGCPAELIGLDKVPAVGSLIWEAGQEQPTLVSATTADATTPIPQTNTNDVDYNFDDLLGEKQKLPLIIRADVEGTLEAIINNLDDESIDLLEAGVGVITEADLDLAESSKAPIIAFHTKVPKHIVTLAKQRGIKIKMYQVIYELIEDLQKQMLKLMEPTIDEVVTGEAEILQIFEMKGERIAGIRVKTGEIKKNDWLHLKREEEILFNPVIKTMRHGKDELDRVTAKSEAGFTFKNRKLDFKVGDRIIAYKIENE